MEIRSPPPLGKRATSPRAGRTGSRLAQVRVGREAATGGHTALLVAVDPRGLPPPVAIERGLARVARLAQTAQVRLVVGAAVVERDHVVGLSHGRVPATARQSSHNGWAST